MSVFIVSEPSRSYPLLRRVTVKCQTSVGCRPAIRPEGVIVEHNSDGFYRVQFEDGSKRWFTEQELSTSQTS